MSEASASNGRRAQAATPRSAASMRKIASSGDTQDGLKYLCDLSLDILEDTVTNKDTTALVRVYDQILDTVKLELEHGQKSGNGSDERGSVPIFLDRGKKADPLDEKIQEMERELAAMKQQRRAELNSL